MSTGPEERHQERTGKPPKRKRPQREMRGGTQEPRKGAEKSVLGVLGGRGATSVLANVRAGGRGGLRIGNCGRCGGGVLRESLG